VEVTAADFRQHYELLSDEALLDTNPDELVDVARQCLEEEIARRGLNPAAGNDAPDQTQAPADPAAEEVLLASFTSGDELNLVRGLLVSASIPSRIENELSFMGGMELRLFVPAEFEQHALEILASEISDEELEAQAEAAGELEDEEASDNREV